MRFFLGIYTKKFILKIIYRLETVFRHISFSSRKYFYVFSFFLGNYKKLFYIIIKINVPQLSFIIIMEYNKLVTNIGLKLYKKIIISKL